MSIHSINTVTPRPLIKPTPVHYFRAPSSLYGYVYREITASQPAWPGTCCCLDEAGSGDATFFRLEA